MIKFVSKVVDKMTLPLVIMNIAAIGAMFYKQGKLDAISELNAINSEAKN